FRWRILLGAFLWTLGLIPVGHLIFLTIHRQAHPSSRIVILPVEPVTTLTFAVLCMLAGVWQVRAGFSSFNRLRNQLTGVRDGTARRIEGSYPTEVQPLVNDLNSLLEHRERIVSRALAKAGDLAHGLKTPLAVLTQEAESIHAAGQRDTAARISMQVERTRRQFRRSAWRSLTCAGCSGRTHPNLAEDLPEPRTHDRSRCLARALRSRSPRRFRGDAGQSSRQ